MTNAEIKKRLREIEAELDFVAAKLDMLHLDLDEAEENGLKTLILDSQRAVDWLSTVQETSREIHERIQKMKRKRKADGRTRRRAAGLHAA